MFLREEPTEFNAAPMLRAITNDHDRRVLAMAQARPVEAQQIMDVTGIARSTVYRRINELLDQGLLEVAEAVLRDGHRVERYRSICDGLVLQVEDASVEIRWLDDATGEQRRSVIWPRDPLPE